ncbi:MAG: hypothetical protein ABIM89_10800 [Mycobacteriales bacterium]
MPLANRSRRSLLLLSLTVMTGAMTVVTALSAEWIEAIFGFEPDGGTGEWEWVIVAALALVTATLALATRASWRAPVKVAVGSELL